MKKLYSIIFLITVCTSIFSQSKLEKELIEAGMVEVQSQVPEAWVELKYATTDNFTRSILYKDLNRAYLHPLAIEKLKKAVSILRRIAPELSILIYDAARPQSVQYKMYESVRNTPYAIYVAEPNRTGLHNYGMALDVTLCDQYGRPLDMGTPFDFFGKAASIRNEDSLIAQGLLNQEQIKNRRLLRKIMTEAGFLTVKGEWWHFNAISLQEARANYQLLK